MGETATASDPRRDKEGHGEGRGKGARAVLASLTGGVCLCGGERAPTRGGTAGVSGQWSVVSGWRRDGEVSGGERTAGWRRGAAGRAHGGFDGGAPTRGAPTGGLRGKGGVEGTGGEGAGRDLRGWGVGFWFRVCGLRGASLGCACGWRGAVTEGGVAGGIPPHKGSRSRAAAPKDKESGERSEG